MTRTAYLRVYQPLLSFEPHERRGWSASRAEVVEEEAASRRWLLRAAMPAADQWPMEGAFVREVEGQVMVCPWRTRLRMLAGMLAFRGSLPEEVADAFVPEHQAESAARELASIEDRMPSVRSHIVHSNWHVPVRWFVAFDASERVLVEDRSGLRIRYETSLNEGRRRLDEAIAILERSWIDEVVTSAVKELAGWLGDFEHEGVLELDYASVAGAFPQDELADDRSSEDVWSCLDALRAGDIVRAGKVFGELSERWAGVRAREVVN